MTRPAMPTTDPYDPARWESPDTVEPPAAKRPAPQCRASRFLKGPVPWPWLQRAMLLPGKALAVGLRLWLLYGMTGPGTVKLCLSQCTDDGIPARTARRAIQALERAGLVSVVRKPGRGLEVTILDTPPRSAAGNVASR